ncbi:MAG: DUF349 domain-containing protein [Halomonas subglaciescola]|nr:DUF349 domain-containing protein [Halomonas subglaciescola]
MQGLLRRLFAPRWQHPRAEIRRQALDQLDPAKPDQHSALEALAHDSQADIRLAALCALDDLTGLVSAFPEQRDSPAWRHALIQRLSGREGQCALATRQALLADIDDTPLLGQVALEGDNLDLRLAALARLEDESDLVYQACHNRVATIRQRAAERVSSEAGLKQLLKESRRDRQVTRLAREHLNRLKADAQWVNEQRTRRETLLEQLEKHAHSVWEPLYDARFRHLKSAWDALSKRPSAEQEARHQQAVLCCEKTLHDRAAEEHTRQRQAERQQSAETEREALLNAFEESLDGACHGQALGAQDIASLHAERRLSGQRWQSLSDIYPPGDATRERYARIVARHEHYATAWQRYLDASTDLQAALDNADAEALSKLVSACQWPDELPLPALLTRARARLDALKQHGADSAALETLSHELKTLERRLEQGAFTDANRLYQRLKPHVDALAGTNGTALKARLKHLGARLAELRDWRGFVAGPKREQLCAGIEALADSTQLTDTALDHRHRQLIKDWKALGDAAATRELSRRFRAGSDRIHQRLAPWHDALTRQRSDNLAAREALCEQLEKLLEQPAEDADPDALRQIRDRSRHQWREYSPVPRQQAEAVGRRFAHARHRLQALIDQRAKHIAAQKRALVEKAQALTDSPEPLAARTAQAKALQQQWRELGRAPKGDEQTLWHAFRRACDALFAERDAHRNEHAERQQQRLDAMQALIERMDAWQPESATDSATLDDFLSQTAALEPLPRGKRSDGMQKRLNGIVRARRERLGQLEVNDVIAQWQHSVPLLNAHLSADQLALEGKPVQDVDTGQILDAPLPPRFNESHRQRNASRQQLTDFGATAHEQQRDRLARLRVHLSLLATGQVQQSDEPLRLAIHVERLNEGLNKARRPADELSDILAALLALGPMPQTLWDDTVTTFDTLLLRLSSNYSPW